MKDDKEEVVLGVVEIMRATKLLSRVFGYARVVLSRHASDVRLAVWELKPLVNCSNCRVKLLNAFTFYWVFRCDTS